MTNLRSGPYLPVGQQCWPINVLESGTDVLRVAAFHHTHGTEKDGQLGNRIQSASSYIAQRSPDPYGRHHDLVNGDSLEECRKASRALPACAKRELDFEILVPATDNGTWRCFVIRTALHENARATYSCPPQKERSEGCERRRSDIPACTYLRVKSGRTFERYRTFLWGETHGLL